MLGRAGEGDCMSNMIQALVEVEGTRPLLFNKFGRTASR
jgi:hypothetical protein